VRCQVDRLRVLAAGGRPQAPDRLLGRLRAAALARDLGPCVRDVDALMRMR
jgi:hypothetical protein